MIYKTGRYSGFLRPISYAIDLAIIHLLAAPFFEQRLVFLNYILFVSFAWIAIALRSNFYEIYRFTRTTNILSLGLKQGALFLLLVFAFFGFYRDVATSPWLILRYVIEVMALITLTKIAIYYLLKKYRILLKGNLRRVVIVGLNQKTDQLRKFFEEKPEYGYVLLKTFNLSGNDAYSLEQCLEYIDNNQIDEIYASVAQLDNSTMNQLIDYADNNLKILKFLPDNKDIYSKRLDFTYYGYLPIISMRKIPIDEPFNKFVKRSFDVALAIFIIVFILSWLTPILGLIIKLESKGPIFFKQKRNGLDYKEFYCYKFRSMRPNPEAHLYQISKNDPRVTRIGKIIRKTSIDELPQFINVLKGEMSAVGPRPHMVSHTHMYAEKIDKFMVRHFIKPGITGLAQVSGFRGEVEDDNHIINRVKYDIFYLENWSLLLDIKIVFQTIYNALRGEEKAY